MENRFQKVKELLAENGFEVKTVGTEGNATLAHIIDTKVKEKITVEFEYVEDDYYNDFSVTFWFNLSEEYKNVDFDGAGEVLAKTLEEYLNR